MLKICKFTEEDYWRVIVKNENHNHDPSADLQGHAMARRLDDQQVQVVQKLWGAGCPPHVILPVLQSLNPGASLAIS
jgi:malonate-semialdehyde dehydrogenase (acetylating)/methylmalonate-semialdehyde dehydrogenase